MGSYGMLVNFGILLYAFLPAAAERVILPEIINIQASVGQSVTLKCGLPQTEISKISWEVDVLNFQLYDENNNTKPREVTYNIGDYTVADDFALTISDLKLAPGKSVSPTGRYRCKCVDNAGVTHTKIYNVQIFEVMHSAHGNPEIRFGLDQSVTLKCDLPRAKIPNIKWDGGIYTGIIFDSNRYSKLNDASFGFGEVSVDEDFSLTISDIEYSYAYESMTFSAEGTYRCISVDDDGVTHTKEYDLRRPYDWYDCGYDQDDDDNINDNNFGDDKLYYAVPAQIKCNEADDIVGVFFGAVGVICATVIIVCVIQKKGSVRSLHHKWAGDDGVAILGSPDLDTQKSGTAPFDDEIVRVVVPGSLNQIEKGCQYVPR